MAPPQDSPAFEESQSSDEDEAPDVERGLSEKEQSEVREAQRPRAPVVYEIIRLEGERELRRPAASLWWSGVAAGISIGFSFLSQAALAAGLPQSQWNHVIASFGYAVGFIIVILGRQQLFTATVPHLLNLLTEKRRLQRWFRLSRDRRPETPCRPNRR
jgi:hypothetical protein